MPLGNATEMRKANAARRRRQKDSYAILTKHIGRCHEHLKYIRTNHFQDGQTAFNYMDAACAAPLNAVKTRELRRQWDDMDLMELVGVQEHTIQVLATKIQAQNAEFPPGSTKDRSECAERLLEMLMDTSKHFQESATDEYNALVGNRRFEHVGHAIHGNHRDLDALVLHYDQQWSAAFNAKLAGFEAKAFDQLKPAEGKDLIDKGKYLKICGKIVWPATLTRPDISMQASHLSSFTQSAGESHYSWGLWIIGYLHKTKDLGITYGGRIRIPPGLSTKPANFDENGGLYIIHDSSWGTRARPLGGFILPRERSKNVNSSGMTRCAPRLVPLPARPPPVSLTPTPVHSPISQRLSR